MERLSRFFRNFQEKEKSSQSTPKFSKISSQKFQYNSSLFPEFPECFGKLSQEISIPFFLVSKFRNFCSNGKCSFSLGSAYDLHKPWTKQFPPVMVNNQCELPFPKSASRKVSGLSRNSHQERSREDRAILNPPILSLKKNNELGLLSKLKTGLLSVECDI